MSFLDITDRNQINETLKYKSETSAFLCQKHNISYQCLLYLGLILLISTSWDREAKTVKS